MTLYGILQVDPKWVSALSPDYRDFANSNVAIIYAILTSVEHFRRKSLSTMQRMRRPRIETSKSTPTYIFVVSTQKKCCFSSHSCIPQNARSNTVQEYCRSSTYVVGFSSGKVQVRYARTYCESITRTKKSYYKSSSTYDYVLLHMSTICKIVLRVFFSANSIEFLVSFFGEPHASFFITIVYASRTWLDQSHRFVK